MTRIILTVGILAALTGCQAAPVAETPSTEPVPALYAIQGRPVVCLAEPHEGKATWRSVCAPVGPWMACEETAETLQCATGRPARMD